MVIFLTVALVLFSSSCQEVYSLCLENSKSCFRLHFWNHLVTRSSSYSWMIQSALNDRRLNASDWSWIDWKRGSALDCIQQHMNVWIKRTSIVKIWRWIVFRDEEGWLPPHPFSPQSGVYLDQSIFGLVVGWEVFTGNTQCTMASLGGMQEEIAPSG